MSKLSTVKKVVSVVGNTATGTIEKANSNNNLLLLILVVIVWIYLFFNNSSFKSRDEGAGGKASETGGAGFNSGGLSGGTR